MAQKALYREETLARGTVADAITAAGYNLMVPNPEEQKEKEHAENTYHYQMDPTDEETYFVKNKMLYITYDSVKTSIGSSEGV